MSVVPTELTSRTLLKKAHPLFGRPLQTSSSPLFEIILSLFLTKSGIPALNLNLPILNSSWHLDQPQSITTNTISCLDQYHVTRYTATKWRCCIHALVPTGSPSLSFVFPTFVRRDQTFLARRTGQRQRGSHQCCTSNTLCTDASCECA